MRILERNILMVQGSILFLACPLLLYAQENLPTWELVHPQSRALPSRPMIISEGRFYAVGRLTTPERRVWSSADGGTTWAPIGPPIDSVWGGIGLEVIGSELFLLVTTRSPDSPPTGIWRLSNAKDATWTLLKGGLPGADTLSRIAVSGSILLVSTAGIGVFASSDLGESWVSVSEGLPRGIHIYDIFVVGTTLFANNNRGDSFRGVSNETGWTWTAQDVRYPFSVVAKGKYLFSASVANMLDSDFPRVNRSEDDGVTWVGKENGLPSRQEGGQPMSLAVVGNDLFVSFKQTIYRSMDDGETWSRFVDLPAEAKDKDTLNWGIERLYSLGDELFAMTYGRGLWRISPATLTVLPERAGLGKRRMHFQLHKDYGILQYPVDQPGPVRVGLFSPSGRQVSQVFQGYRPSGMHTFSLSIPDGSGAYLLRAETPQGTESQLSLFR